MAVGLLTACVGGDSDDYIRGHELKVASIPPAAESQIVEEAIRAAFNLDPALILRVHPLRLPRGAIDSGSAPMPSSVVASLRSRSLVSGTCTPVRSTPKNTPHCSSDDAGYIIRVSDVFTVTPDTAEVYFAAEKYGPAKGPMPEALRFEKVYKLVKSGQRWRIAREGRLHER